MRGSLAVAFHDVTENSNAVGPRLLLFRRRLFLRNLCAGLSRFGQPDRDGLLLAFYGFAGAAALESSALALVHCLFDFFGGLLPILGHVYLLSGGVARYFKGKQGSIL